MFCPQCGSTQSDDLKFCKSCGANLEALRQIMATRDTQDKFDWSNTWVAEMFMSSEEAVKREAQLDRLRGRTPEVKRRNEIKAGVITASSGLGLMLVLLVIMEGIIISGRISDVAAEILSRVWIVGVIPLLVGIALIFNGMVVSKKSNSTVSSEAGDVTSTTEPIPESEFLPPADTNELFPASFSVTDETTKHLKVPRTK